MKSILLTAIALGQMAAAGPAGPAEPSLAAVRAATERFRDVNVALAEGYVAAADCETATHMGRPAALGAMGVHYFRLDLLGITSPPGSRVDGTSTHTDFLRPAILIYEPQRDGSMQLVAVENLVFEAAWRATGRDLPPTFHGRTYDHMVDDPATTVDEAHHFAPHFDQHLWLYRANPAGTYTPFNPRVSCAYHRGAMIAARRSRHSGH
jgi:hypothetical protein